MRIAAADCETPVVDPEPGGVSPVAKFITSYIPLVSFIFANPHISQDS